MAISEKRIRKVQSMAGWVATSLAKPMSELAAIISSEVPTASRMGSRANSTRAGMIMKPPPAPTSPVTVPTAAPCAAINP